MSFNNQQDFYNYLVKCSDSYYNTGSSLITDNEFDKLVTLYNSQYNQPFKYIGTSNVKKAKLPVYMGSLDKVKDEQALKRFLNRTNGQNFVISSKIDGVSLLLVYKNNKLNCYSRGDGFIGSDITHISNYLKLPSINTDIIIRGELVLPKSQQNGEIARNRVSGLINSKNTDTELLKKCVFIAYCLPELELSPTQTFNKLKSLGFETAYQCSLKNIDMNILTNQLKSIEQKVDYEIDGIVVAIDKYYKEKDGEYPDYTIAFKQDKEGIHTKIEKIEWTQSRYNTLFPRAKLEPVVIDGVTITYASCKTAKFVLENKLGPGSVVEIIRAGGVIPDIVNVIKGTKADFPDQDYTWDSTNTHISSKEETQESQIKIISHFLEVHGAKGIKEAIISKMFESGLDSLEIILNVTKDELLMVENVKDKMADKILQSISLVRSNLTIKSIMIASSMFQGFGEKKIELCLQSNQILNLINGKDFDEEVAINELANLGIKTMSEKLIIQLPLFLIKYKNIIDMIQTKNIEKVPSTLKVKNDNPKIKVVFTGFRDKELKSQCETIGIEVLDTLSKTINILVTKDEDSTSSKAKKALDYGIQIMSLEKFKEQYL